jgi:hypothetical protein
MGTVVKFPNILNRTSLGVPVKYWEHQGRWYWRYTYNDVTNLGDSKTLNGALYNARQSVKGSLLHRTG